MWVGVYFAFQGLLSCSVEGRSHPKHFTNNTCVRAPVSGGGGGGQPPKFPAIYLDLPLSLSHTGLRGSTLKYSSSLAGFTFQLGTYAHSVAHQWGIKGGPFPSLTEERSDAQREERPLKVLSGGCILEFQRQGERVTTTPPLNYSSLQPLEGAVITRPPNPVYK